MVQHRADRRHPLGQHERQAAERVDCLLDFGNPRVADRLGDVLELGAGIGVPHALADRHEELDRRLVVLVLDVADDLFDEVLDRDDPVGTRELVDHDREVGALGAHVGEHVESAARLWHVERLAHQLGPVGRRLEAPGEVREDVLDVHHPDHLVERVTVDRQTRMAMFGESVDQLCPGGVGGHSDDLAARDGDVVGVVVAEMEQVAQHRQFDRRQVALRRTGLGLVLMLVDRLLDLRAQRGLAVLFEEAADRVPKAASTVRVSVAGVGRLGTVGHRRSAFPVQSSRSQYGSPTPRRASAFVSSASIASASAVEVS